MLMRTKLSSRKRSRVIQFQLITIVTSSTTRLPLIPASSGYPGPPPPTSVRNPLLAIDPPSAIGAVRRTPLKARRHPGGW